MKTPAFALVLLIATGFSGGAQEVDNETLMKLADTASSALEKLEKKVGPRAVASAERLGVIYEYMFEYYRGKNVADAARWSEAGKAAAVELASAANAGEAAKADAAFKTLTETCQSCHKAHRESTSGRYRFK